MSEEMYTYHYYKTRSIIKESRVEEHLVRGVLCCGVLYATATFLVLLG